MKLVYSPHDLPLQEEDGVCKLFLAGTIDMGNSRDWQTMVVEALKDENVIIYNPRRPDWDFSWTQSMDNPKFYEQVMWELSHIHKSNIALFNFEKDSKSCVTMMELGITLGKNIHEAGEFFPPYQHILVNCPDGFWRKGNVDMTIEYSGLTNVTKVVTMDEMIEEAKELISDYYETLAAYTEL